MAVLRTACAVVIAITCAEGSLQQPAADGRPLRQEPAALVTQAHDHYKARQWQRAIEKYEAALAASPQQFDAWLFLANSYDNLYRPARAGDPVNDGYIQKAIEHYRNAAERAPDPQMRKRALQYLIVAYGPEKLNDAASAEPIVHQMIHTDPNDVTNYFTLSKVQEDGGRHDEAELTLLRAKAIAPADPSVATALSALYHRLGDFEKTMAALHDAAQLEPTKAEPYQRIAVFYWEKAFRDQRLSNARKRQYIAAGLAATDRALAIEPDYIEALTYKNILLRMQANQEPDSSVRQALIAEADVLRERAIELGKGRAAVHRARLESKSAAAGGARAPAASDARIAPMRVGGNVQAPRKVKHARPVPPKGVSNAQLPSTVIVDATIDTQGRVSEARVLRSVPDLDEAALAAVRQWEFEPTSVNGSAVPVIMTITVTFQRR